MSDQVTIRVLIDDGTPRIPFPLRMHLSLTVYRLKQMIEAQEGFTVSEQEVFFQGRTLQDNLTLGQQDVQQDAQVDIRVNFQGK